MSTRFGFRLGRRSWVSLGRSGPRVGGRIGPVRVSTGRSGTRLGAGRGRAFVSTWVPARRPPARHRAPVGRPVRQGSANARALLGAVVLGLLILAVLLHR